MAGRLFVSRLDEARSPVSADRTISFKKTPINTNEHTILCDLVEDTREPAASTIVKSEYKDNSEILEKLCEYLFDLFDANLMDDYLKMEKFEIRALESFQDCDQTEFTHEQHALHNEFVALFEQLVEGFLQSEGYTIDIFYDELVHFINKSNFKTKGKKGLASAQSNYYNNATPADEVMQVISSYIQFDVWADLMRKQAKRRCEFRSMKDKINEVAVAAGGGHPPSENGSIKFGSDFKSHK